jgi:hypothetical protein
VLEADEQAVARAGHALGRRRSRQLWRGLRVEAFVRLAVLSSQQVATLATGDVPPVGSALIRTKSTERQRHGSQSDIK